MLKFVIQDRYVPSDHLDFRLEKDSAVLPWTFLKGSPKEATTACLFSNLQDQE